MRVGGDGGIGVKYWRTRMPRWSACSAPAAWRAPTCRPSRRVRTIKKLQVFSPTRENREHFGREMAAKYNIEVEVCDRPEDIYKGADIVAALTDSAVPVIDGTLLEKGAHIVNVGGSGKPDAESLQRVDVYLRFGDAPAPVGQPELAVDDEYLGYEARPDQHEVRRRPRRIAAHGNSLPDKRVTLADIVVGKGEGPHLAGPDHLFGARQPAGRAILRGRRARSTNSPKRAGLGREIPTEWFLQDIRD